MSSIIIPNPYRELSADITDKDFEVFCTETLKAFAKKEKLQEFCILQNQNIIAPDGTYQIDIFFEFSVMQITFKGVVECKKYTRPVERKVVAELFAKLNSIGANKGVIISSSGFQSGAVEYAKAHGISLIQLMNKNVLFIQNSVAPMSPDIEEMLYEYRSKMPKYFAYEWDCNEDFPNTRIYPSNAMMDMIRSEITQEFGSSIEDTELTHR